MGSSSSSHIHIGHSFFCFIFFIICLSLLCEAVDEVGKAGGAVLIGRVYFLSFFFLLLVLMGIEHIHERR